MKLWIAFALASALAFAQPPDVLAGAAPASPVSFGFYGRADGQGVKGAPYSADTETETIQTLADGNRIVRKNKSSFARDAQGRTRRETEVNGFGPLGQAAEPVTSIVIDDPVTKTLYNLDPKGKTVVKTRIATLDKVTEGKTVTVEVIRTNELAFEPEHVVIGETVHATAPNRRPASSESLGERTFEGVSAKGTRTVMTIPAGEVGNEKAIEVVTETWFSDRLKTAVYMRHHDPRFGETITRLVNIQLGEPSAHLFLPPADYKTIEPQIVERRVTVRDEQ